MRMAEKLTAYAPYHRAVTFDQLDKGRLGRYALCVREARKKLSVVQPVNVPDVQRTSSCLLTELFLHSIMEDHLSSVDRGLYLINTATASRHTEFSRKPIVFATNLQGL